MRFAVLALALGAVVPRVHRSETKPPAWLACGTGDATCWAPRCDVLRGRRRCPQVSGGCGEPRGRTGCGGAGSCGCSRATARYLRRPLCALKTSEALRSPSFRRWTGGQSWRESPRVNDVVAGEDVEPTSLRTLAALGRGRMAGVVGRDRRGAWAPTAFGLCKWGFGLVGFRIGWARSGPVSHTPDGECGRVAARGVLLGGGLAGVFSWRSQIFSAWVPSWV